MGLFDTVHCEYPLPDARHQGLEFQTKDLDCLLDTYTITIDGRLLRRSWRFGQEAPQPEVEWPIHGDVRFYTHAKSLDPPWVEYVARFTRGRVEWILPLDEARRTPGVVLDGEPLPQPSESAEPVAEPGGAAPPGQLQAESEGTTAPSAEEALLLSLRRDRAELEKLLHSSSDHWGYEDPVYRFYHQSFKVYGLQRQTRAIVERLQALAPDRPLNRWFVQIVAEGTGKEFTIEDNARWTEVTRPILEAFFHARFFLEMAMRYADLPAPPNPLPSGYAALLYLYGLR